MKPVLLGTFYGNNLYIEVNEKDTHNEEAWRTLFDKYLADIRDIAVENYKKELPLQIL